MFVGREESRDTHRLPVAEQTGAAILEAVWQDSLEEIKTSYVLLPNYSLLGLDPREILTCSKQMYEGANCNLLVFFKEVVSWR